MKYIVNLLLLNLSCIPTLIHENESRRTPPIEEEIVKYIKRDLAEVYKINSDTVNFVISNKQVEFALTGFSGDFISQKFIKGFSVNNPGLSKEHKALITKVQDSLRTEGDRLNKLCPLEIQPSLNLGQNHQGVCLFFSKKCDNKIFVEAISIQSIFINSGTYSIYGNADTYLFEVVDNKIKNVFRSQTAYN
jgi:hypothetical protein